MVTRDCVYCGNVGSSKEHVWPKWLRHHALTVMGIENVNVQDYLGHQEYVGKPREELRWRKGNSRLSLTITDACITCNNGWMSHLETDVRTALEPMVEGRPVEMDSLQSATLQAWAIKTALNLSFAGRHAFTRPIPPKFPRELYANRETRIPVSNTQVMIARYEPMGQFAYRHMAAQGHGVHPVTGEDLLILRVVFVAGHAAFLVRMADPREGFRLRAAETSLSFAPIFAVPQGSLLPWPRGADLDDQGISEAMNRHIHGGIYAGEEETVWAGLQYLPPT